MYKYKKVLTQNVDDNKEAIKLIKEGWTILSVGSYSVLFEKKEEK